LRPVYTFGRYLRERFGKKVYKVPVSLAGFTCPNIDGTVAIGGCTFCENESFSPNLQKTKPLKKFTLNSFSSHNPLLEYQLASLETQYAKTSAKLSKKFKAEAFIVYFQSFSNTYAPLETLKALYEKALSFDGVVGLSIGTRSDCVSEELLDYLALLAQEKEIWVEFGIQSVFEITLERINRGHGFESIEKAVKACKSRGLKVCGHLIFGLPDESEDMMLESVEKSIALGIDSFKFHPLYVVKNTALANDVKARKFEPISEETFLSVLSKAISILPSGISVQRVCAGVHDDSLVAPNWCKNKHEQMSKARAKLLENGLIY
jgi:uncharacterized protein